MFGKKKKTDAQKRNVECSNEQTTKTKSCSKSGTRNCK